MYHRYPRLLAPLLSGLVLLLTSCEKEEVEVRQLPPATQVGANTFGCLLNGKAYEPYGSDGNRMGPLQVVYDPTFRKGTLSLFALRLPKKSDPNIRQTIGLYLDSVQAPGRYALNLAKRQEGYFFNSENRCEYTLDDTHYRAGEMIITRLDKQKGIVAGTFHFKLYRPGCDSVIVSDGRFDVQL